MHCLKNIRHSRIPNDVIRLYLKIYPFIGRNREMLQTVSRDFDVLSRQTVWLDSYFLSEHFGLTIIDARKRHLLTKDGRARNKDERFLKNIKAALARVHERNEAFNLQSIEIYDLLKFLYRDVEPVQALQWAKSEKKKTRKKDLLASTHPTKREALDALIDAFKSVVKSEEYEISYVIVNFYIDFYNLAPFTRHNDVVALMVLYVLLTQSGYDSLHLSSFFELLHKRKAVFEKHVFDASHNWSEGLADVMGLHRFILEILLESYQSLHELLRNYTFDKQTNKSDYVENTINKLGDVFSKEEIRREHPTISESTINRTLKRMRDEKRIRPLGKGRSAKWMKLYPSRNKPSIYEQIKLKV